MSPLERIALKLKEIRPPNWRAGCVAPGFGGCGYLPQPWRRACGAVLQAAGIRNPSQKRTEKLDS
ncbi:hypothetical protein CWO90_24990 [Bradyrhizobium sp. Leo121]|nr:hypothetical protein CWO90_24990 [Bradyrhizobium sp. Leo121]